MKPKINEPDILDMSEFEDNSLSVNELPDAGLLEEDDSLTLNDLEDNSLILNDLEDNSLILNDLEEDSLSIE